MRGAQARRCHPWALVLPTTALIFFLLGRLNSRPLPRAGGRHVLPVQVPTVPHALAFDDEQDSAASRGWPPREQVARLAKCGRIVLAIVNCGFLDFADNWAQSLLRAGVGHFAFVPLDQNAYAQLREHYPEHTIPPLPSELGGTELPDSKEHTYGTPEYFRLIRGRQTILLRFLHQGHAVFLSDVDTVWMSDALDEVPIGMYDMMAADDGDMNIPVGTGHGMYVCAGMLYLEPTAGAIELLRIWRDKLTPKDDADGPHTTVDQFSFNSAIRDMGDRLHWEMLEGDAFPPGFMFFKDSGWKHRDSWHPTREPVIVHNNWIKGGDNKRRRFVDAGLWNPSGKLDVSKCS